LPERSEPSQDSLLHPPIHSCTVRRPLRVLQPQARTRGAHHPLVSAVQGMVTLGLEEKLYTLPLTSLREQVTFVVSAIG